MFSSKYTGVYSVLYALFDKNENLDFQLMERQLDYILSSPCHGIAILGLATEVLKLSFDERKEVISHTSHYIKGRVPLAVTIAGNSVFEQIMLAQYAEGMQTDWLILQPPLVGNYNAQEYMGFFSKVAQSVHIPIAIQNAKAYLGRDLNGDEIRTLCKETPNITHIKAENTPIEVYKIKKSSPHLVILNGRGGLEMTDGLQLGCEGFVLAPDISDWAALIYEYWQSGERKKAEEIYQYCLPEMTFVMQSIEHLITYGKRIFGYRTDIPIYDRSPCLRADETALKIARKWADHLGEYKKVGR